MADFEQPVPGCDSCPADGTVEDDPDGQCPNSQRPCGHHCNHSWSHDHCDWCGKTWGAA